MSIFFRFFALLVIWRPSLFCMSFTFGTDLELRGYSLSKETESERKSPHRVPTSLRHSNNQGLEFRKLEDYKYEWNARSINYYGKVMREERRRRLGQAKEVETEGYQEEFVKLASKHYFALLKIKDGKPHHAEQIYKRILSELRSDSEDCDHARLAVTTLLLALLLQRTHRGEPKRTRSVFLNFFRVVVQEADPDHKCACSAKVLQAYALFEMKQGNALKSLELVRKAVQLDPTLKPVLQWKQFRDVSTRRASSLHP